MQDQPAQEIAYHAPQQLRVIRLGVRAAIALRDHSAAAPMPVRQLVAQQRMQRGIGAAGDQDFHHRPPAG